jgi:mono/diheme cytochrome c family protein
MKGFLLGIVATLVSAVIVLYVGITQGVLIPPNADAKPPALEKWAASRSLRAAIDREMTRQANPVPLSNASLIAGIKLYAANCAACHGVASGPPSTIAVGLYQHAPQLGRQGVEDDPQGETLWKIQHGIRLTGMPSYTKTLSMEQMWTVTLFLKHMNSLPPGPRKIWETVKNPVALAPASALPTHGRGR